MTLAEAVLIADGRGGDAAQALTVRDVLTIRLKIPRRKACRFESGPGHQGSQRERLLT